MRRLLITAAILISGRPLAAAEPCVTLDNKTVASLFDDWNYSLSSLDANQVVQRYWPNAVLLPTVSNTPRTTSAAINDYFVHFLVKRPRGHIDTRTIQTSCNMAVDMGTYTFSLMDDKGTTSEVAARYTFVYQYRDGAWKILHHHSSAMPEGSAAPDAHLADAEASNAPAPAKVAHTEPAQPKARKPRRKDYLDDPPVASKPAHKPAATAAHATPVTDAKPAAEAKIAATAKPASDSKPAPAAKAAAQLATPGEFAAPPPDTKPSPEVRTAMFANLTSSPSPAKFYPPEAMRKKERGSVNLKVCADGNGAVTENMEILRTSGSKLLDDAAMTWARSATWVPATYNRQRVEGCAKVDVAFEPPPELAHARR
jgi:uncharacterized protein (TIGR02246 family)